jgi:hypothetical protein
MNKQQEIFWEIIDIFNQVKLLPHILIIGSWAEYIYELHFKEIGYKSNLRTMDIDFFYPNINKPNEKIDLRALMDAHDYVWDISNDGITKFYKEGLEIEFLVRELGKGKIEPYKIEPLNIKAEGLRNLDILLLNCLSANVNNYLINIPAPQAYVLHKLTINSSRKNKAAKDIRAVKEILALFFNQLEEKNKLKLIYENLTKKQKALINKTCLENDISLF